MGTNASCFRPLFMFLLLVGAATIMMLAFYYRSAVIITPLPSGNPPRESLAARSLLGAVDVFKPYTGEKPLLTMFTTFKNAKDRFQIHSNVLHNWALYRPVIQPILFTFETDENLIKIAKTLGWLVIPSPKVSDSKVPYFKEMYFEAQKHVESTYYGYFNGDLLFDDGLINTLIIIERYLDQLHQTLIVGQRTNFPVKGRKIFQKADVTATGKKSGKLFRVDAEDFFVIAHNSFIWDKIADIVIGRPAYDNYIVGLAIMNKVSVVDATKTLLALHQSGSDGDFAGHKNKDRNFNFKAIGPFRWSRGVTSASQYFTKYKDHHIELWRRSPAKALIAKVRTTPKPTTSTVTPTVSGANQTYNITSFHRATFVDTSTSNNSRTAYNYVNSSQTSSHQVSQLKSNNSTNYHTSAANRTLEIPSIKSNSSTIYSNSSNSSQNNVQSKNTPTVINNSLNSSLLARNHNTTGMLSQNISRSNSNS